MNDEKIAADYKVQGGSVLHLESFTSKQKPVTKLSVQDAEEQRKGRKEQEEGKERERGLEERAGLQGGWPGVRPGDKDAGQRTPRGNVLRRGETTLPHQGQAQEEGVDKPVRHCPYWPS